MKLQTSAVLAAACGMLGALSAQGQVSELFLFSYTSHQAMVIQNGQVVRQFSTVGAQPVSAAAITDTIKIFGRGPNQNGREYSLSGGILGGGPYYNPAYVDVYDGTTDGVFNYAVAHNDFATNFAVIRADSNWSGAHVHFVPTRRCSGIAYDSRTNTLWTAVNIGGYLGIQQYSMSGTLLNDFVQPYLTYAGYGMAYDAADDTFWITGANFGSGPTFDAVQIDKTGQILQIVDIPNNPVDWIGAAMRFGGGNECDADFNGDGQVDFFDYLDFVQAFDDEDPSADFNGDGQVDFFDYLDFVAAFSEGCD